MKVLAIVQAWNSNDPIRGFTVRWMEVLAERMERLVVLALEQHHPPTCPNIIVYSLGKENSKGQRNRLRYLINWHRHMKTILRKHAPDVIFTHMTPIYSVLAAPYARWKGIPIVTWYAHRQVTTILKLAHHFSDRMVSINESSYPYRHDDKFVPTGHGIDTLLFSPSTNNLTERNPPLLLSVGRLSPIKDPITFVRAAHLLRKRGREIRCVFVGEAPERDYSYAMEVRQKVRELGLEDTIEFVGAVPSDQVASWYWRCVAHINLCSTGALDKAVLEAMACGKPSLVANMGFRETLGQWADWLLFRYGDARDLAEKVEKLLQTSASERQIIGIDLHRSIIERHGLERLADRLIDLFHHEVSKC